MRKGEIWRIIDPFASVIWVTHLRKTLLEFLEKSQGNLAANPGRISVIILLSS